ncbi:MAG TPA: hypothetical protein VGN81_37590 [Pseudonocardiaceae bacterium]|jgi:hypothetical protein
MNTPLLWLKTRTGYVALAHVAAIEAKSFTSGDERHAVVASVAATAGNQDRVIEESHVLVWRTDLKSARQTMRRVIWEIVRCQASGVAGIISVDTDGEVVFDRASVSDQ